MKTTDPERTKSLLSIQTILKGPLYQTWRDTPSLSTLEKTISIALPHISHQAYHFTLARKTLVFTTPSNGIASQLFYKQNDILKDCQRQNIAVEQIHIKVCVKGN